ncbi:MULTISPECIES: hypothetical protein [Arsenicicoccus]|uniref:hypothetical protein n=1 Tax=Arsenicicoccus TaxID=267408 RepID=UPI00257B6053|nr:MULTISPECIES: hypothetical protein [Arsenicicoccus]
MNDLQLDDALRPLDPARDVAASRGSHHVLAGILAAPRRTQMGPTRRTRRRRAVLLAVGAAAAASLTFVAPALRGSDSATAGWSPTPDATNAVRDSESAQQCHFWVSQNGSDRIPSTVVLTERRGDWVLALLTTSKGPVTCLHDQRWHREASGGLAGPMALPAPPSSTGIVLTRAGASARDDGDPIVREVAGRVLPDVTRVVVHTAARGDVTATVVDGWVVAWWPGEPMGSDVKDADGSLSDGFDCVTVSRRGAGSTTYPAASLLVRN